MAAYNAGEGKILRAMEKTGARDFWQLAATSAIRRQTQNYVPAFLASVLISKNPTHYGFDVVFEPPIEFETVRLDRPVDLGALASGSDLSLEELQALNPELRSSVTPRQHEGYELKVPQGTRETVLLAFRAAPTAKPPSFKTHVAKKGETLPRIAKRYGVSVTALASANSAVDPLQGLARPGDPDPAEGRAVVEDEEDRPRQGDEGRRGARPDAEELQGQERRHALPDRAPSRRDGGGDPRDQQPRRHALPQGGRQARASRPRAGSPPASC